MRSASTGAHRRHPARCGRSPVPRARPAGAESRAARAPALLHRSAVTPLAAIEHLVGLQAQAPNAPYVGLHARLDAFDADEVSRDVAERRLARTHAMRWTIHLLTARDCGALRPLLAPSLAKRFASSPWAKAVAGVDVDALVAAGAELLARRPSTRAELGDVLAARFPPYDGLALAYTATLLHPTVQTPPRGLWRGAGQARWLGMAAWLGAAPPAETVDDLVLRYLRAFGPATVADLRTWSGMTGLRPVVERLRPRLATFRDERGRERFDLPDAPRPDPDTPAPPRFRLGEYGRTCCSGTRTARTCSRPVPPSRSCRATAGRAARCSSTASTARTGGSRTPAAARRCTSRRSRGCRASVARGRGGRRAPPRVPRARRGRRRRPCRAAQTTLTTTSSAAKSCRSSPCDGMRTHEHVREHGPGGNAAGTATDLAASRPTRRAP